MPRVTLETPHALDQEEAVKRLKKKSDVVKEAFGSQVNDLRDEWNGNTLSFAFKVLGMSVSGTLEVEASLVRLVANLPLAAMMFKGKIEQQAREELGALLA